jgi:hypothetical protein
MNRRDFSMGLAALFSNPCTCHASGKPKGCRTASVGDFVTPAALQLDLPKEVEIEFNKAGLKYSITIGSFLRSTAFDIERKFNVKALLYYYDDGNQYNALATPDVTNPQFGPDGTVMIGIGLTRKEIMSQLPAKLFPRRTHPYLPMEIIIAHEFAHILQYKKGLGPDGPWQMEPHADFMAGWYIGKYHDIRLNSLMGDDFEPSFKSMLEKGDTLFNDPSHHGQPELRAAMVRAGVDASDLELDLAFHKGSQMANLKLP